MEVYMSSNKWDKINYASVPSRANLIYNKVFLKHDKARKLEYLESNGNTICVSDGSGSMCASFSRKSSVSCLDITQTLSIYFAERSSGRYCEFDSMVNISSYNGKPNAAFFENIRMKYYPVVCCYKMVLSNKLLPLECLLEQINSERYQSIEDTSKDILK
ncbi:hypothetical protein BCR32DRAFT_277857 [Anaeromyces robustus]|uniref:DUF2828 domain-containing protein n=1 Tax=Anaeromyces robustus TaxID=1754192 RepID=A0A1Y1XCT9_9FUNG|nr:hypothetical protein BCR32DRAFT_277857 [Anaeromyces robustus]|eukprot:ORX83611.1 hypothetical protein BCR32DRAFT_277857 [Anaeromyces robustus]